MVKKKSQVAKKQRRKLTADFKARVALAALREDKTLAAPVDLAPLHAKIGQLALENDFLAYLANEALTKAGRLSAR